MLKDMGDSGAVHWGRPELDTEGKERRRTGEERLA